MTDSKRLDFPSSEQMRTQLTELGIYRLMRHYDGDVTKCANLVERACGKDNPILQMVGRDPQKWLAVCERCSQTIKKFEEGAYD